MQGPGVLQAVFNQPIVIYGNNNGIFIYQGIPGPSTLLVSIAPAGGTDQYGNVYQAGFETYSPQGSTIQVEAIGVQPSVVFHPGGSVYAASNTAVFATVINAGLANEAQFAGFDCGHQVNGVATSLSLSSDANDGSTTGSGVIAHGTNKFVFGFSANQDILQMIPGTSAHNTSSPQLISALINPGAVNETSFYAITSGKEGGADAAIQLYSDSADGVSIANGKLEINGVTILQWNAFGITCNVNISRSLGWTTLPLPTGWVLSSGSVPLEYQYMTDNSVWIMGKIQCNSATATSLIGTLPAGLRPATVQGFVVGTNGGGATSSDRILQIDSTGAMTLLDFTNSVGTVLWINGRYPLDA